MTQWDLARASGVGWASVARIETGRQDPTTGMLERLAAGLGISPLDLVREALKGGEAQPLARGKKGRLGKREPLARPRVPKRERRPGRETA